MNTEEVETTRSKFRGRYAHFNCRGIQTFIVSDTLWMSIPYFVDIASDCYEELTNEKGDLVFPILNHDPEIFNEVLNVIKYNNPPSAKTKNRYRVIATLNEFRVRYFDNPQLIDNIETNVYGIMRYKFIFKGYSRTHLEYTNYQIYVSNVSINSLEVQNRLKELFFIDYEPAIDVRNIGF